MTYSFTSPQTPGLSSTYALNPNPDFSTWPIPAGSSGTPPSTSLWGPTAAPEKVLDANGVTTAQIAGAVGADGGLVWGIASGVTPGWYVLDARFTLASGALTGAGVYTDMFTAGYGATTGDAGIIDFTTTPDASGSINGAGTVGATYSYKVLFQIKLAASVAAQLYAFSHWTGFGHSEASANSLNWYRCVLRPATFAEIAAGNAQYGLPLFPVLPGQSIAVSKAPLWSTKVKRAASGRERRTALWPYPLWQFDISYEVVRQRPTNDELAALWVFFNTVRGQYLPFLFLDPSDFNNYDPLNTSAEAPGYFATGDGATTTFQISRYSAASNGFIQTAGYLEPVYAPFGMQVFINGAPTTAYAAAPNGRITFASAPAAGAVLTWEGFFYFGCRFLQDDLTFERIVSQLWSGKSLKFTSLRA